MYVNADGVAFNSLPVIQSFFCCVRKLRSTATIDTARTTAAEWTLDCYKMALQPDRRLILY